MDFSKLNAQEYADKGAVLQVLHPATGEPLEGVTITLLGQDSKVYKGKIADLRRRVINSKGKVDIDRAETEAMNSRVAMTIGWNGIEENGEPKECTPDNVRYFYDKYDWLIEQVDKFVGDRSNFFPTADES
jgi:hypothetical protein